jgi:AraC family L-rhamnose operon regulatory protein RhaS
MATQSIPTYRERGHIYLADSCLPVVEAVKRGELRLEALARGTYPASRRLPRGTLPGLRTVGYWNADQPQTWGLPWHRNEGIELTYLETGGTSFALPHRRFLLRPGDLTITRPWQLHRVGTPRIGVGRLHWIILDVGVRHPHTEWTWPSWLVIDREELSELTANLRGNEQPVWKTSPDIQRCFQQIGRTVSIDRIPVVASRLAVFINELLLHLLEMFRQQGIPISKELTSARRSTRLFLESLRENLTEPWTLDSMAEACGLGTTRFVHYCKQLTNRTPMHHLSQLRSEMAAHLLRKEPGRAITDIAFACGFSSSQYFATTFRRHMHCTPRDYRERPAPVS